jgi:hypothetical protein
MLLKSKLLAAAALAVSLSAAGAASAAGGWQAFVVENYGGDEATAQDWVNNVGSALYVGSVPVLNFDSNGASDYTIGSWLATGGFTYNGAAAGDTLDNTLWLFYTNAFFNVAPNLTIAHDDGIQVLYQSLSGPVYDGFTSGPTSPISQFGTCPSCSGSGQVGIIYNESFGPPGVLEVQAGIPEPTAWSLMIMGFGALGSALRFRRKTALA